MGDPSVLDGLMGAKVIGFLSEPFENEHEWAVVFDNGCALLVEGGLLSIADPQQTHSAIISQRERLARDASGMEDLFERLPKPEKVE